ncbi:hypothetical protein ANN_11729 [Periplaneta americana]|uniref:Uncharacterized protein n=1 Tax=Periplaneta americana TaxID=6978 RepID=A0ABQ8T5V5_PERAM|nr:hypothetical protein ANN_11729 [Periplaneta americana]
MAGLCEGGNEPSGSLKAICKCAENYLDISTSTDFWKSRESPSPSYSVRSSCAGTFSPVSRRVGPFPSPPRAVPQCLVKPARYALSRDAGQLALRNARWFESSWGKKFSHEISASVWDRCPPSIVMHLGSYDRQRNPVAKASCNGWGNHRANHTIPPFWLDDRPLLPRHVDVKPAAQSAEGLPSDPELYSGVGSARA